MPMRVARDTVEPDLLLRVVFVGEDQRDFDPMGEQHPQTAHADIVIGKDNGARHGPSGPRSSIDAMM